MNAAKTNNYGITHAGYATDMTEAGDLRTQIDKAGITYQQTDLQMGTLFSDPACIVTYTSPQTNRIVSVLIIPLRGPDSWCEEYYVMAGTDHAQACARNWSGIVNDVRKLYQP